MFGFFLYRIKDEPGVNSTVINKLVNNPSKLIEYYVLINFLVPEVDDFSDVVLLTKTIWMVIFAVFFYTIIRANIHGILFVFAVRISTFLFQTGFSLFLEAVRVKISVTDFDVLIVININISAVRTVFVRAFPNVRHLPPLKYV